MNVFITGSSKGLGEAFAKHFLKEKVTLYGIGRSVLVEPGYEYRQVDISDLASLHDSIQALLGDVRMLDLVLLNAGVLGRIQDTSACSLEQLKYEMDVNMWANKVILDCLIHADIEVKQVIAISSGASVNGSLGWNGYSLSKAALNMLIKLYAAEMEETHLCALAPGLVKTEMLQSILEGDHDTSRYTSVQTLRDSEVAGMVQTTEETVERIIKAMPEISSHESGAFLDIRALTP